MTQRLLISALVLLVILGALTWMVSLGRLPPADFSFSNGTEVQSLDPAVVSGAPEGRILWSIFECLVQLDPDTREARPGVAESWDVSEDGRTYTWRLRDNARWSDGTPVTAHDFYYSYRRFLDPLTAAKYSQAMWYVKNGERYTLGASKLKVGDKVEVELHERPAGTPPHARGTVLRGELVAIERDAEYADQEVADNDFGKRHTLVINVDGEDQRFRITGRPDEAANDQACKAVLIDFNEVGIRVEDDHTLVTELNDPTPFWPELVGFYAMSPVNRKCVETHGWPEWTRPENIVTNGPYEIQFRRIRDRIRLVKSDKYWDKESVQLGVIDALVVDSLITAFNLYETGQIDWSYTNPKLINRKLLAAEPPRSDFNPAPQLATYYYNFNTTREPLNDVRVRKALALALDREQILDTVGAGEPPAYALVPPGMQGYTSQECAANNVAEAQRLLAEAGYPEGVGFPRIEILYNSGAEEHETIAELVRKQWQERLGISVSGRKEEWGTYLSNSAQLNYDICRRSWIGDYMDPNTFLDMYVSNNGNNQSGYAEPEYDALIAAAGAETDPAARMEILMRAERMLMDAQPLLPVYTYVSSNLIRPNIRGFYNNLQDSHPLKAIWIDPDLEGPNEYMRDAPLYNDSQPQQTELQGAEQ
ncbi:Periplasmic oligopeptide-binding protein precursor [Posidoniimonas polymericola]|uniref:Periplasmic oligopeptide-binding protein n=1 Tax=Posidoniimonas polymericola TaxID=2528002 RepID=A0A5C5ZDN3_9BACT|nr:peptide ABC transporter substrate-binding protein [Posidoniimonas polymericola]TWT85256.1 Periplasmic oligopeptide-binding protein precursor [Posidoniimonas polymericola]